MLAALAEEMFNMDQRQRGALVEATDSSWHQLVQMMQGMIPQHMQAGGGHTRVGTIGGNATQAIMHCKRATANGADYAATGVDSLGFLNCGGCGLILGGVLNTQSVELVIVGSSEACCACSMLPS
jgi:hypothetical protein